MSQSKDKGRKRPASTAKPGKQGTPGTQGKQRSASAARSGVRGPQGPSTAAGRSTTRAASGSRRARFEQVSARPLTALHRLPRWIMVVAPGLFLFGGLVLTGPWALLGALLLLLVGLFLGWLLALAWPRLSGASRMLRLIIIVAIVSLAYFKALGRF